LQLMEADKKLTTAETELLYNPDSGALNQKGTNAFKTPEEVNQAYSENVRAIEESLTSPKAKLAFKRMAAERGGSIDRTLQKHVSQEYDNYNATLTKTYLETKQAYAVQNYQDPQKLAFALSDQMTAIEARGKSQGLPAEAIELMKTEAASQTHQSVITRMIDDGNEMFAEQYFNKVKEGMTPDAVAKVNNVLEAGLLLGKSQRLADSFVAKSSSMAQALSEARKIDDPKLREAATDKVKEFYALKDAAERQDSETYMRGILDQIDNDPSMDLPPSKLAGLSYSDRTQMQKYHSEKRSGKIYETDLTTFYNLKYLAANPKTKDEFLKVQLNSPEMKMKLSQSDWKTMLDLQTDLRYGNGKGEKVLDGWRTEADIVSTALGQIGIDRKKNPEQYNLFARKFEKSVLDEQERLGRKLNSDEFTKLMDLTILEGRVNRPGFFAKVAGQTPLIGRQLEEMLSGEKVRAYELTPEEVSEFIPLVPKDDRKRIEAAIRKQGAPVTEEAIARYYMKKNFGK